MLRFSIKPSKARGSPTRPHTHPRPLSQHSCHPASANTETLKLRDRKGPPVLALSPADGTKINLAPRHRWELAYRSKDLKSDWGGTGKDWTGRRRGRGQAGSAGKETRPPGEPGRGRGEVSPQLPDSEPAGAGSAGAFPRGRAPGPSTARTGIGRLRLRGPAGYLPALQPRSHESPQPRLGLARRGRRAEARPAGPSPSSTSSSRAPGCSDDGTAAPHSLLQEEGIPGLPHPSASLSTSTARGARPHSRLRPSSAGAGRGRGRGGGEGGGCGYLRARPACSPELAPRPPGLERPPPSGAGALRELRAVPSLSPSATGPNHLSGPNMAAGSGADSRGGAG